MTLAVGHLHLQGLTFGVGFGAGVAAERAARVAFREQRMETQRT